MTATKESRAHARRLFDACMVNGVLDTQRVRELVSSFLSRRPPRCLPVLNEFYRLVRLQVEASRVIVESAVALSHVVQDKIAACVKRCVADACSVDFVVCADLIAGGRVRIGSDVYEANVRERLERLQRSLC
jgi:F0F1-type ATP synthase delta subunit